MDLNFNNKNCNNKAPPKIFIFLKKKIPMFLQQSEWTVKFLSSTGESP